MGCRAVQQCDKRKKVTLTPDDILEALREAEFEDFEQPMKDALQQFRSGGASGAKKGVSGAKKQKLDDSANGPETPTGRPDADNTKEGEEGEDEAGVNGGPAADGEAGDDDKMEEADDDDGKDDDEKDGNGKDDDGKDDDGKDDEKDVAQDDAQHDGKDEDTAPGEADEATDNV